MYLGGATVQKIRELIEYARKCEEAAYQYMRPTLWPERYSIIEMLDKVEKKCGVETVLKPIRLVQETVATAGESEEEFVARMARLEYASGETENGTDWVRIYSRYVKLRDDGNETGLQLDVS
jgi:hypothetical protein